MRFSKKVLLPMAALSLAVVTGTMAVQSVSADEGSSQFHPMIQSLIDRFHLNDGEVETMMDEYMTTHQAQMHQEHQARLDAAVASGHLTEEQRASLQAMMDEHQSEFQEMRDLPPEARREEAREHRAEMQAWADANGVDLSEIMPHRGEGRHGSGMGDDAGQRGAMGQRRSMGQRGAMGQHIGYGR